MYFHDELEHFRATHSLSTFTGMEDVRLVGFTRGGKAVWVNRHGHASFHKADVLPIPGRHGEHQRHLARAAYMRSLPESVAVSRVGMKALLTWPWVRPENIGSVSLDQSQRIVRRCGRCWVLKSNASAVLRSLGLSDSHMLDGFGNGGPRGREWWLKTKFRSFSMDGVRINGDCDPWNEFSHWTIDVTGSRLVLELLLWELKQYGRQWQIAYGQRDGGVCLGFSSESSYFTFIREVLVGRSYEWMWSDTELSSVGYNGVTLSA